MNKTLIGISTYGNVPFTQLTIRSIRETTKSPIDFFVIVGKPGDAETAAWLKHEGIAHRIHETRLGFPVALNDMKDYAWNAECRVRSAECGTYDNLIIVGNDVVAYPNGVDALIEEAARGEWEWICSSQFDVKSLVDRYPELKAHFNGPNLNFEKWVAAPLANGGKVYQPTVRPWEVHKDFHPPNVQPDCIKDVRNLCLFRRSVFEKIGYADVNFWPGGYFEDNDYCYRARLAGVKACGLAHSAYFHFWSRTIHQGEGTTSRQFQRNSSFYVTKWGGGFDSERNRLPFNGNHHGLCDPQHPERSFSFGDGRLKIETREHEEKIARYWESMG